MLNRCSPRNQTALLLAVYKGHVSSVEYLLEHGADPNISNKELESPLYKGNTSSLSQAGVQKWSDQIIKIPFALRPLRKDK